MSNKRATLPEPAEVSDYADKYKGEGTHVNEEYTITPRVVILQGLSPQVKRNNPAYVEGAQPGMIFLSLYHRPLVDGNEGIIFQPCVFRAVWDVRTPRESGAQNFIATMSEPQSSWTQHRHERGYIFYVTPEKYVASQVHEQIGLVHIDGLLLPYAIRFAGTGMFVSRTFNGMIAQRRTSSGEAAPRFAYLYRMRVKSQTNNMGEWGQWAISPHDRASDDQIERGHSLFRAFKERQIGVETDDTQHQAPIDNDAAL
jgi:hypothetical protein